MIVHTFSHNKTYTAMDNVAVAAQVTTYGGATTAVASWGLSLPEWCAIISVALTALGFLTQFSLALRVFYKDAQDRREAQAARKMRAADDAV